MGWAVFLVVSSVAVFALMKYAGSNRRAAKVIKGKGRSSPRICPDCREPAGKCQYLRRQAEHPGGMLGKKK